MTKVLKSSKPKRQSAGEGKKVIVRSFPRGHSVLIHGKSSPVPLHSHTAIDDHTKLIRNDTAVSTTGDFEETHIIALSGSDYLQLQRLIDDPPTLNENTVRAIEAMRRKA
jgi:hypothetical protein